MNKDTHVIASTNAAAAELLQRVHRIAASGTFDPSDKRYTHTHTHTNTHTHRAAVSGKVVN